MDAGNIIYIIAIIIYFIYTALKKAKPDAGPDKPVSNDPTSEQKRPVSFDDLLKEIRQGQQSREKDFEQTGQGNTAEKKFQTDRWDKKPDQHSDRDFEEPVQGKTAEKKFQTDRWDKKPDQHSDRSYEESAHGKIPEKKFQTDRWERRPDIEPERATKPIYQDDVDQPKAYGKFQGEVSDRAIPKLKTLDEQVNLSSAIEGLKSDIKVIDISGKKNRSNRYKEMLRNPETVKDAVILSEILNRKNF